MTDLDLLKEVILSTGNLKFGINSTDIIEICSIKFKHKKDKHNIKLGGIGHPIVKMAHNTNCVNAEVVALRKNLADLTEKYDALMKVKTDGMPKHIVKARLTHPNAFTKWEAAEETLLKGMLQDHGYKKEGLKKMSDRLGRSIASIEKRLKALDLIKS